MAQNDTVKRYLDAGMQFTQLSREKAEEFVKELVKAGEVRRKESEKVIETLLERSRKNTEDLVALIRQEIADQLRNLGLEELVKRAGLPDKGAAAKAADRVEDAAADVADAVAPAKKVAAAKKTPAAKKLIVPGQPAAPAKKAAKKLVVPGQPVAPAKKAPAKGAPAAKKAAAAKKTTKKS
jgi:polyhydroxyalkanoate synthesis regulator phasin